MRSNEHLIISKVRCRPSSTDWESIWISGVVALHPAGLPQCMLPRGLAMIAFGDFLAAKFVDPQGIEWVKKICPVFRTGLSFANFNMMTMP
jgi:hypothetical protein